MSQEQQSSNSGDLIWFILMNGSDGKPFMGTTAAKVSLALDADVVDFRDAVKAKYSNKLSSVDAGELLVYKNKATFDSRTAAGGNEEPLKSSCPLIGLGNSKENALVVVVPNSIHPAGTPMDLSHSASFQPTLNISGLKSGPVIPHARIFGTLDEPKNEAYRRYTAIAQQLKAHQSVVTVGQRILEITSTKWEAPGKEMENQPIVFLGGSSGTGKSQMAFNIMEYLQDERKVFYLLFTPIRDRDQAIYRNFSRRSKLFQKCIDLDKAAYSNNRSCNLFGLHLYFYGLIYQVILEAVSDRPVSITPKTGRDIFDLIEQLGIISSRPVFIIDECIAIVEAQKEKIRYVHNCLRSVGLGIILMGTDCSVAKLLETRGSDSRSNIPMPWCYVYSSFPGYICDTSILEKLGVLGIAPILLNSRPLFATLFLDLLDKNGEKDLDWCLALLFIEVASSKKLIERDHGKLGQARLLLNAHHKVQNAKKQSIALIHSHFAKLDGESEFLLNDDGKYQSSGTQWIPRDWKPESVFPSIEDDVLLYLAFSGGRLHSATGFKNPDYPFGRFLNDCQRLPPVTEGKLSFQNVAQDGSDGTFLEALCTSAICLASHSNGIRGIDFAPFLLNLVFQLQLERVKKEDISIGNLYQWSEMMNDFKVPFLSPPNDYWPKFVKALPDTFFGSMKRQDNSAGCDIICDGGLYAECKDHGSALTSSSFKSILENIKADCKLLLIFARKIQLSYFTEESQDLFSSSSHSHIRNMALLKLDASKPNTAIEVLYEAVPLANVKCLVIVILVNPSIGEIL